MAPLALMHHKDVRLNQLLRTYIDGIPLDLASSLLPGKTRAMFSILSHIHACKKSKKISKIENMAFSFAWKQTAKSNGMPSMYVLSNWFNRTSL